MYIPKLFKADDLADIFLFCERYSFATVISGYGKELTVNHFPVILNPAKGSKGTIIGHMAKANPRLGA